MASASPKSPVLQGFSRMSYREMEKFMGNENRERLALRMQPETRRRIEQWYAADNCQSMNEFVEKAVNFYVDHLEIQDNQTLLLILAKSVLRGTSKTTFWGSSAGFAVSSLEALVIGDFCVLVISRQG